MQQDKNNPQRLAYGISEAVAAVSVGRSLLYEEIKAGRLRAFRVGKRRLIDTDDLKAWLNSYRDRWQKGREG